MKTLSVLVKRNAKIYFQDKGLFLTSLITPLILLVLYGTFLRKVYEDSFRQVLTAAGIQISDKILAGCVGGQLFSSMLAVSCVTVAFCSNLVMVQDKVTGARRDLTISPVKASTLALGYYFATLLSTLIVCLTALGVCFVYLAITGWCLRLVDVAAVLLDVILLVLFGTALSSCILFPMARPPGWGPSSAPVTALSAVPICPFPPSPRGCRTWWPCCPALTARPLCGTMP